MEQIKTDDALKRYKAGKAGFSDKAHLKAKGLIPRADGSKRKSESLWDNIRKKRARIDRGVTEEQREAIERRYAPKERRIIEGVAPKAKERLSPSELYRFAKDSDSAVERIDKEKLPTKEMRNAQDVAKALIDLFK